MEKWHCFNCRTEVIRQNIQISYLDMEGTVRGFKCPKCGEIYLTEEDAVDVMENEKLLEAKA